MRGVMPAGGTAVRDVVPAEKLLTPEQKKKIKDGVDLAVASRWIEQGAEHLKPHDALKLMGLGARAFRQKNNFGRFLDRGEPEQRYALSVLENKTSSRFQRSLLRNSRRLVGHQVWACDLPLSRTATRLCSLSQPNTA